jgi:hypothetical protein
MSRLVALYKETLDVAKPRRHGPKPTMTESLKDELFELVCSSPRSQLRENLVSFETRSAWLSTSGLLSHRLLAADAKSSRLACAAGVHMHISSISKTVKHLGFSRKRLRLRGMWLLSHVFTLPESEDIWGGAVTQKGKVFGSLAPLPDPPRGGGTFQHFLLPTYHHTIF